MRFFYFAAAALCLALVTGCVDVRYIGDVYPPTQNVRFFMNEKDVPPNTYIEMGTAIVAITDEDAAFRSSNVLSDALREKAMEVGADALVIISNERYKVGTRHSSSTNTYYSEREKGRSSGYHGRHHSHERYRSHTRGYSDTYSTSDEYDLHKDEVKAKFLKKQGSGN